MTDRQLALNVLLTRLIDVDQMDDGIRWAAKLLADEIGIRVPELIEPIVN